MKKIPVLMSLLFLAACQASGGSPGPSNQDGMSSGELLAAAARGANTYQTLCASCHGDGLGGGSAPTVFDDVWVYGDDDQSILTAISTGLEEVGMPGFGDSLSAAEQSDLLVYMRAGAAMTTTPPIDDVSSVADQVQIEDWITGLDEPWGFVFTGVNDALITEKKGTLRHVQDGVLNPDPIRGTPDVLSAGQGGLLDVALDPDFSDNGWVYLAFSDPKEPGSGYAMTKVVRGRIAGGEWTDEQIVFQAEIDDYVKTRFHYGSRITFDSTGKLYFSIGDRGKKDEAQDLSVPHGKIHRVNRDGTIPDDNPFAGMADAYASIYSYGNRNPQGLIVHPETGVLWETEHGPKGGDELNAIKAGVNYGWPVISYGRNYSGTELTPYTAKPGMAQPASQWTPSIAVCGLDVYTGDLFPQWKGRLMAGALRYETVRLIEVDGDQYVSEATLIKDEGRVRDVTTGPDGAIYVALPEKIVRLSPKTQ